MQFLFLLILSYQLLFALDIEKPTLYKNQTIKGWFMSEKLDGIRAIWDGKVLRTKNGNIIHAPKDFTYNFPSFYLDGELWSKRNDFENIQSIVLDKKPSQNWHQISYNIFEVPYAKGHFEKRLEKGKQWFRHHPNKHIKFLEQIVCKNKTDLEAFLQKIVKQQGEGVIIKKPNHTTKKWCSV